MGYAFSRDGAVPFSHVWYKVNKQEVPLNVVWLSVSVAFAMALTVRASPHHLSATSIQSKRLYIYACHNLTSWCPYLSLSTSRWGARWHSRRCCPWRPSGRTSPTDCPSSSASPRPGDPSSRGRSTSVDTASSSAGSPSRGWPRRHRALLPARSVPRRRGHLQLRAGRRRRRAAAQRRLVGAPRPLLVPRANHQR